MSALEQRGATVADGAADQVRARTGSPPCMAARVISAAGLSGMTSLMDRSVATAWPSFAIAVGYG